MNTRIVTFQNKRKLLAFSLVEMITVVAVIGIITGIGAFQIGKVRESARMAKDMNNAQNLASIFQSATAAGVKFDGNNVHGVVASISEGVICDKPGVWEGAFFGLRGLSDRDRIGATRFLNFANGTLTYDHQEDGISLAAVSTDSEGNVTYLHSEQSVLSPDEHLLVSLGASDKFFSNLDGKNITKATVSFDDDADALGAFVTSLEGTDILAKKTTAADGTEVLTLTGAGTTDDYLDALESVQFSVDKSGFSDGFSYGVEIQDANGNTFADNFTVGSNYTTLAENDEFASINQGSIVDFSSSAGGFSNAGGSSIDLGRLNELNLGGPWPEKTLYSNFTTGSDITGHQTIYEQGGSVRGYSISILPDPENNGTPTLFGQVYNFAEWDSSSNRNASVNLGPVEANQQYLVALVHEANSTNTEENTLSVYVNGQIAGQVAGVEQQYEHPDVIGIGAVEGWTIHPLTGRPINEEKNTEFKGDVSDVQIFNNAWSESVAELVAREFGF